MSTATPDPRDRDASWRQPANPFATCHVRPSAMRYRFAAATFDLQSLAAAFIDQQTTATAIVGPHGSGKSTLLGQLAGELQPRFPSIHSKTLRIGESTAGLTRWALAQPQGTLLIVDGLEQLPPLRRWTLLWVCYLRKIRCLATSHTELKGFDVLHRTGSSIAVAKQLAGELLVAAPEKIPAAKEFIDQIWDDVQGNLRELWFAMYDWYQIQSIKPR